MNTDRIIQLSALGVVVVGASVAGSMLPGIVDEAEEHSLRYTDTTVENAPPIVALGTAIGALRGLVVDYLWIKANLMQEEGLYYDILEDARLITKLQPRFPYVWLFHGHNMAYNISVMTNTPEERWEWVNKGIRLVRDEGLRYNPNDILLYKDLAFWLGHKIEGVSDDAHLYYKRMFAKEWHEILGTPPLDEDQRIAWIEEIAEAPDTIEIAIEREPSVEPLVAQLEEIMEDFTGDGELSFDRAFLKQVAWFDAVNEQSWIAQKLDAVGMLEEQNDPLYAGLAALKDDPAYAQAWPILLAHTRKKILQDEYNMKPEFMAEFTRDLGPLDWRHPQAHALYWARLGSKLGEHRVLDDDEHHRINTDRQQLHSLQSLARSGRVNFDPFSPGIPGRFPEPRFIDTIDRLFEEFYIKYVDARGAGGETFMSFMENFMSSAVREAYREGELDRARAILDRLDSLFGRGAYPPNHKYAEDLDVFVKNTQQGEYDRQPHLAVSDVIASLRYGIRMGIGQRRPEVYQESIAFANDVTEFFRTHESVDFDTKFGSGRMRDMMPSVDETAEVAFIQLMIDPSVPWEERVTIWSQVDELEPQLRLRTWDRIKPLIARELSFSPISAKFTVDDLFPEPPGMKAWRQALADRALQKAQQGDGAGAGVERR